MKKLSDKEIKFLTKKLKEGEDIPLDFKYRLFPTEHKEYELVYEGKMRKEDILSDEDGVTAVPLQVEKVFNGNRESFNNDWKNMIVFGDNLQFLKTIYKNEDPLIKDKVKGKVKLIYIDPPFATESDFSGSKGQKAYTDKAKDAEFVEFLRRRLIIAKELLCQKGSIMIHLDYKKVHYIKVLLDEVFGVNNFINEIIWERKRSQAWSSDKFGITNDTILFYSKKGMHNFNPIYSKDDDNTKKYIAERFRYKDDDGRLFMKSPLVNPKLRPTLKYEFKGVNPPPKGWLYSKKRMQEMYDNNELVIPEDKTKRIYRKIFLDKYKGQMVQNIWKDIPIVNPMAKEASGYPTQKPEVLLERIINSVTNPGDLIMDFFGGSGTTIAVAEKLDRKWIACDIGKYSYYTMQKRILTIQDSKSLNHSNKKFNQLAKSFITVNTGFYDIEKLFSLQKEEYINFVLNLFEVTEKNKTINGVKIDGERKDGYEVIVWNYWDFPDAAVDEDYLENLNQNIGSKLGDRIYIIAPANSVQFIDDYYEINGLRYYFLKVPYQVIQELHKKKFKKFRQPSSSKNINALDDAIGFHFIRQPEVDSSFENGKIVVNSFSAYYPDEDSGDDIPGFEALAMILIDKNYNGEEFIMSDAFFSEDLLKENNEIIEISLVEFGYNIGLIYVDIYGNEFREFLKTS